jgi:hypothetical protein
LNNPDISKNTSLKEGHHASGDSMHEGMSRLQLGEDHLEHVINLLIQECSFLMDDVPTKYFPLYPFLGRRK